MPGYGASVAWLVPLGIVVVLGAGVVVANRLIAKSRTPAVPSDLRRADDAQRGFGDDTRTPGQAASDAIDRWHPLS